MAYIQLQLRRGTASQWTFANPVLANGELGLETDTRLYKIGDGVTYWNSLVYGSIGSISTSSLNISNTASSTSTTTGALVVSGGVAVGGNLNVGGSIFINGQQVGAQSNTATNIAGGATGSIPIQSNAGRTGFIPIGGTGSVLYSDGTTATWQTVSGLSNVNATNVYVQQTNEDNNAGGIFYPTMVSAYDTNVAMNSVGTVTWNDTNNILSSPKILVTATNASVSTVTGALTVAGGIGVGKGLYVGGIVTATNMFLNGYQVSTSSALAIQLAGVSQGTASTINFGTGTTVSVGVNIATVQSSDTLQLVTGRGASTTNALTINNSAQSTSTATGALQVVGGAGIGGNLYVGGTITANQLTIQYTTITQTQVTSPDIFTITNVTSSTNTVTGALTVAGGVGIGGNLNVGGNTNLNGSLTFANASTLASPKLQAYQETVTTIGTVSGATNINCALSNIFDITLGAASVTFTFTNPPASGTAQPITVILRQDATGNRTATFTNAKYTDGSVPVLSTGANQVDVLTFFTVNGGTFWFGTFAMANVS